MTPVGPNQQCISLVIEGREELAGFGREFGRTLYGQASDAVCPGLDRRRHEVVRDDDASLALSSKGAKLWLSDIS